MYPKNSSTPPAIDLGQILLLADGTIQTTGASVRVRIGTGAWGAGAGTLACDTTSGIWTYAPTQAETNAEYFIVAAYKADCSALSKTVITSDSSVSGRVNVQTLQTDVITAAAFATSAVDEIVDAVYDEPMSGHTVNGSYGSHLVRSANQNQNTVQITGSQHIAADVHEFQPGVITSGDFAAGAITSTVLATDSITSSQIAASAVTEIQAGLATTSGVTAAFTEIKGAGWSSGTDTLEEIADAVAAISTGNGTGARTVTVTVNDGTTALQNAKVRMTSGAETYTALTNVSGVCTFNLNDATWVVSITRNGYSFSGTTLVVDGTETVTYSMSLVTITPSSTNKVTGYWTVLNENGVEAASVVVTIKARQPLRGGAGLFHDAGERTATSNANGLVQFTNLIPGWRYAVVANDDYVADVVVPADAVTSVELGSIVARLP